MFMTISHHLVHRRECLTRILKRQRCRVAIPICIDTLRNGNTANAMLGERKSQNSRLFDIYLRTFAAFICESIYLVKDEIIKNQRILVVFAVSKSLKNNMDKSWSAYTSERLC